MERINVTAEALGKTKVYNEKKKTIPLSDLWKKRQAVLVFVRHFG